METEKDYPKLPLLFAFLAGVILVLLLWLVGFLLNQPTQTPNQTSPTFNLEISSPKVNLTTNQKDLLVTGHTGTSSVVTIALGNQNTILKPTTFFATKLTLNEGKNLITVTAFNPLTGESSKQTREVLYLNEDLSSL